MDGAGRRQLKQIQLLRPIPWVGLLLLQQPQKAQIKTPTMVRVGEDQIELMG
jgi:hypothetical protein